MGIENEWIISPRVGFPLAQSRDGRGNQNRKRQRPVKRTKVKRVAPPSTWNCGFSSLTDVDVALRHRRRLRGRPDLWDDDADGEQQRQPPPDRRHFYALLSPSCCRKR